VLSGIRRRLADQTRHVAADGWVIRDRLIAASSLRLISRLPSTTPSKTRVECHAAVDEERRAGDAIRVVRYDPNRGRRNVLRFTDAAVRDEGQELPLFVRYALDLLGHPTDYQGAPSDA
jgi:hypothetical protein